MFNAKHAIERLGASSRGYADRNFVRAVIALANAKRVVGDASAFAASLAKTYWSDTPDVADGIQSAANSTGPGMRLKGTISPTSLDGSWAHAASTFVERVRAESVIGQMRQGRRMWFNEQGVFARIVGTGAAFVKAGEPIPVYATQWDAASLPALTVGGITVATREFFELATKDDSVADTLDALLSGAAVKQLDAVFCSDDAAVTETSPAGILADAQTIPSTGSTVAQITQDLRNMIDALEDGGISLRTATWILSPEAFAVYSMAKILDVNGSTLAGLPIIRTAPQGVVALLAQEYLGVAMLDNEVTVTTSSSGTVELRDDPANPPATLTSLFQKNLIASRATLYVNWQIFSPDDSGGKLAVVQLSGASYA